MTLGARIVPAGSRKAAVPLAVALVATMLVLIAARRGAGPIGRGQGPTGPARVRTAQQSTEPAGQLRVSVVPAAEIRVTPQHLERADAAPRDRNGLRKATRPGVIERSGRDRRPAVSYGVVPRTAACLAVARVGA